MSYTDPTKRHEFVLLFDVTNGNPNGDPDAGNLPRIDPETMHGLVTDVCIKRKVRDYVAGVLGRPIFIQSETALNTLIYQAARESGVEAPQTKIESEAVLEWLRENPVEDFELDGETLSFIGEKWDQKTVQKNLLANVEDDTLQQDLKKVTTQLNKAAKKTISREDRAKTREKLIETRYDIRMFGAVLSTGLNAGQVRGPMQLTFAQSIDPIFGMDVPITRVAITREEDRARKETEMGRKAIVPYGLYRAHGFYNPFLARRKTGENDGGYFVTTDDLSDFWEALEKMFQFDHSAARGEMNTRGLWVFTHESEKGDAPAHKLFKLVDVLPCGDEKRSRSFEDYEAHIKAPKDGPVSDFPKVTVKRLV